MEKSSSLPRRNPIVKITINAKSSKLKGPAPMQADSSLEDGSFIKNLGSNTRARVRRWPILRESIEAERQRLLTFDPTMKSRQVEKVSGEDEGAEEQTTEAGQVITFDKDAVKSVVAVPRCLTDNEHMLAVSRSFKDRKFPVLRGRLFKTNTQQRARRMYTSLSIQKNISMYNV